MGRSGVYLAAIAPTTSDIVQRIREAKRAVVRDHLSSKNAANTVSAIAYEFTFDIQENNNTTVFPNGGNFSLVVNTDSERQRHSTCVFKIVDTFDEHRMARCDQETLEKNLIYPIAEEIGIYEVV